jgi:hypothetical protein
MQDKLQKVYEMINAREIENDRLEMYDKGILSVLDYLFHNGEFPYNADKSFHVGTRPKNPPRK